MPLQSLSALTIASVATLPPASENAGALLRQGGKLWSSNGTSWVDLEATGGGGGGSQEVFVQQTRPSTTGPWVWWQTDEAGVIVDLIVNDGGP